MNILRTVGMAFALYSRIPMPRLDWESESRKYTLYAFPLVGIAVGIFELLWLWMSQVLDLHTILTGAVLAALPIWVTGGIHLDGFCDVCDARASHQSRERKLEILKDSNVGAFAVIHCVLLLLSPSDCGASWSRRILRCGGRWSSCRCSAGACPPLGPCPCPTPGGAACWPR